MLKESAELLHEWRFRAAGGESAVPNAVCPSGVGQCRFGKRHRQNGEQRNIETYEALFVALMVLTHLQTLPFNLEKSGQCCCGQGSAQLAFGSFV